VGLQVGFGHGPSSLDGKTLVRSVAATGAGEEPLAIDWADDGEHVRERFADGNLGPPVARDHEAITAYIEGRRRTRSE
jgi:hypothetical protein